jgi:hypothetical protein
VILHAKKNHGSYISSGSKKQIKHTFKHICAHMHTHTHGGKSYQYIHCTRLVIRDFFLPESVLAGKISFANCLGNCHLNIKPLLPQQCGRVFGTQESWSECCCLQCLLQSPESTDIWRSTWGIFAKLMLCFKCCLPGCCLGFIPSLCTQKGRDTSHADINSQTVFNVNTI